MKNKTDAHRIRIIRPGIRKPRFGILKISDNKKKLIQQLLIVIMSVVIWSIFNLCPLIPVTHSTSDSGYSEQFVTQETLPYVVYHGFHWTHYGRVGWCGVEPQQHWTHFADPIISFLFMLSLFLLIQVGMIIWRRPRIIHILSRHNSVVYFTLGILFFYYKDTRWGYFTWTGLDLEGTRVFAIILITISCSIVSMVYYVQKRLLTSIIIGKLETFNLIIAISCLILSLYFINVSHLYRIYWAPW